MCIVVDTNTVAPVFSANDAAHREFEPVLRWLLEGKGKLVYGGSTYRKEVFERMPRYRRFIEELKRNGKCVVLDHDAVDEAERRVRAAEPSPDFDDAHLIAIFDVSGCVLLCSNDDRADRFVKNRKLYEQNAPPRIYRRAADHTHLLRNENIAACCKPSEPLPGDSRATLRQVLPRAG
jgi:predicted nucleic acid-binding protein